MEPVPAAAINGCERAFERPRRKWKGPRTAESKIADAKVISSSGSIASPLLIETDVPRREKQPVANQNEAFI